MSVLYVLLKHSGEQRALQYVHALQHVVAMIDVNANTTIEAAGYEISIEAWLGLPLLRQFESLVLRAFTPNRCAATMQMMASIAAMRYPAATWVAIIESICRQGSLIALKAARAKTIPSAETATCMIRYGISHPLPLCANSSVASSVADTSSRFDARSANGVSVGVSNTCGQPLSGRTRLSRRLSKHVSPIYGGRQGNTGRHKIGLRSP
jgi:hypothetical protein